MTAKLTASTRSSASTRLQKCAIPPIDIIRFGAKVRALMNTCSKHFVAILVEDAMR
jgi:hypothetical protein